MTATAPAIEIRHVSKAFGKIRALRDATASIPAGQVVVIAGSDGAGKTTLLRLCMGLVAPDGGTISVLGEPLPAALARLRHRVGYLPQRLGIHMHMTVRENVEYFAALAGVGGGGLRERMDDLLEITGLAPFINRLAAHLSGGMQQKLALTCAVIHQPQLILLDEPSTGLDPLSRRDMWELIYRLHGQGCSIVVATPSWDEAARGQTVFIMHEGRLMAGLDTDALTAQAAGRVYEAPAGLRGLEAARALPWVLSARAHGQMVRVVIADDAPADPAGQLSAALGAEARSVPPALEDAAVVLTRRATAQDDGR